MRPVSNLHAAPDPHLLRVARSSVAGLGLVAGAANAVQLPVGKTSTMLAADMATTQH